MCDGWKLDEEGAERALRYFRRRAAAKAVDEAEEEAAIAFLGAHGRSLDWVVRGDPVGMISRLAGSSDALDAQLLELGRRYDELAARYDAACEREQRLDDEVVGKLAPRPKSSRKVREWWSAIEELQREIGLTAAKAEREELQDQLDALKTQIVTVPAASIAGMRVKARVIRWYDLIDDPNVHIHEKVAGSLAEDLLRAGTTGVNGGRMV